MDHITIDMPDHNALSCKEWMMMCLPGRWGIINLHQLEFTHRPATNAEFFARLKLEYEKKRYQPFPSWRFWSPHGHKVTGVHFVKFRLAGMVSPRDVWVEDEGPCLPDDGEEGWVRKVSATYPSKPPLNADTMLCMLRGDILEGLDIYDLVPRKLKDALPMERGLEGWGLYFAEEEYWKAWYPAVVLGGTLVFACGARVVLALAAEKTFGLTMTNDVLVGFELTMVMCSIILFLNHLRDNQRLYWDLTEFR